MYGMEGEKLDHREESKLSRTEVTTIGRLRNGHHPELKYWWHKIGCVVDTICRKCRVGEETAEHVVYDCSRIHNQPHEPTPPDTLAKDPQKAIGEVDLHPRSTRCLTATNHHHHLIYPSNFLAPHPPICHLNHPNFNNK